MKIIYQEKYRSGSYMVKKDCLPRLFHVPRDLLVESLEIKVAGVCEIKGEKRQYQDVRIILKESAIG